jgi:O-antigen/teichoic acid export membrane protein
MKAGVALNLLGATFNQGSTFAVNLVVANLLGREAFGEYTMILATMAMLATLGQLSMGFTATKHVAEFRSVDPARTSRILGLCALISTAAAAIVALALALPAQWLASSILRAPHLLLELRLAAVAVFFTIINGCFTGALAGLEGYRALALTGVTSGTLYLLLCTAFAWRHGLSGAVAGVALSALVQTAILVAQLVREATRQGISVGARGFLQERRLVMKFALPASLTGFLTFPAVWIANAVLARQPGGYHQLALFGAANSFRTMMLFVPQTINNVGMSILNNQRRISKHAFRRVFWMNAALTVGAAAIGAVAILLAMSPLLRLFGNSFADGRIVLLILLIPAIMEASGLVLYQLVVSHGRMWASLFFVGLPRDVAIVSFAAVLTPGLGAVGLAAAYAAGWTLGLGGLIAIVSRLGIRSSAEALPAAAA